MRILIFLCLQFLIAPILLNSQSLYDLRWQYLGVDYAAFMIFFDETDIYMRAGYSLDNGYNLVHSEYQYSTENTSDFVMMESNGSSYVYSQTDDRYQDFHFMWFKEGQDWIGPIAATTQQILSEDFDNMSLVQFTELEPNTLTAEYLQWFYTQEDPDYYALLNANTPQDYEVPSEMQNQALTMHVIVAANTAITDIGASTKVDLLNLTSEFEGIAAALNMKVQQSVIAEDNFNRDYLMQAVHSVQPGPNDIVVFLYSGHGFRFSDQQERFPMLDMRKSLYIEPSNQTCVNLKEIYDIITAKGARLNIILGDCCNENIGVPKVPGSSFIAGRSTLNPHYEKLAKLFLGSKGNIIGAGAVEGEFAIGNTAIGGYFTSSFITSIRDEVSKLKQNENPNWENILTRTVQATLKKSQICQECSPQNAFFYETVE